MRILALSAQLPFPPHSGKAMRDYALLTGLAARHEVRLLAFASPEQTEAAQPLRAHLAFQALPPPAHRLHRRLLLLLSGQPDLIGRTWSPAFLQQAYRAIREERPDVLLVEGLEMAHYGLYAARAFRASPGLVWVLDEHNAEYALQRRAWEIARRERRQYAAALYSGLQARRLARFEAVACLSADGVIAVSASDRDALLRIAPGARIGIVPNGVDTQHYAPLAGSRSPQPPTLVFSGRMDFRPNVDAAVWFCREIWPRIRAQVSEARFLIVGHDPTPAVRALGTLPGVQVVGAVADDRPWIGEADLYVLPMRFGGGVRFKLLQALSMARATVSTPLGAEGLEGLVDGEHIALAETAEQFAAQVLRLLSDAPARERMGRAGRTVVVARYDWRMLIPRFEEAISQVAVQARSKEPRCGSL
ncbi:MAG: glycosyltransferase family 4 protein [Chloroflexia bacterium]